MTRTPGPMLLALVCMWPVLLTAQGLPPTNLWLADLVQDQPTGLVKISTRAGYNNQPHFSMDGSEIYYTRENPADDGSAQTDIAAFDIASGATRMVIQSDESEYSPTPVPGRRALSVIRVESDQKQRLWAIGIDDGKAELLLEDAEPVGYHAWINARDVALFILGDSFTLQIATLGQAGASLAATNIGRTLRRHPVNGEVLYVDKNSKPWKLAAFDPSNHRTRMLFALFPESEDFAVDSKGFFWTGNDSRLYRRDPNGANWRLMAELSGYGIRNISRLAISPGNDRIALVADNTSQSGQ